MVKRGIENPQNSRIFLEGSVFPPSENILNTKIAESTEVTKKVIIKIVVTELLKPECGNAAKKLKMAL